MKLKLLPLIKRFIWLDWLILALLLVLVIYLLVTIALRSMKKSPAVEYLTKASGSSEVKTEKEIWVDVSGAVVAPGVYKLTEGARIKDALVAAGGISSTADRTVVAKEVNLAAIVTDGQKIYISAVGGEVAGATTGKVNLNKATTNELMSLDGIGTARAQAIIKNRPYAKVEDILTKKVVTKSVFEKIKDQITVY